MDTNTNPEIKGHVEAYSLALQKSLSLLNKLASIDASIYSLEVERDSLFAELTAASASLKKTKDVLKASNIECFHNIIKDYNK